jgi:arginyl-tRNA synthetase
MNTLSILDRDFKHFLSTEFGIDAAPAQTCTWELITDEKKAVFGDITTSAAMILAKELKQNPRAIAQRIVEKFKQSNIAQVEIAGKGFINMRLTEQAYVTIAT